MHYARSIFKQIFVFFISVICLLGASETRAAAGLFLTPNPILADEIRNVLWNTVSFLKAAGLPVGVIMVLFSALLYMTAGGKPQKIKRAHTTLIWSLVGMAVLLIGQGFVTIVCNFLNIQTC